MDINIIIYALVLLGAVWIYFDSKKYQRAGLIGSSIAWSILTFLFWLPIFPIYLILRFLKYQKLMENPAYQPNKLIINLGIILVVMLFILLVIYSLIEKFKIF